MNFGKNSKIKSRERMLEFLNSERIGRISTIDADGFSFIAPMNFVYFQDAIYVHGFPRGEKYDNIKRNPKCGFEVDRELAFLPSYFFEPPTDASLADTMYVSVVIKGTAEFVLNLEEKASVLNALMEKTQTEGGYQRLMPDMASVRGVGLLKIIPHSMTGKYKLGKYWSADEKLRIATRLVQRSVTIPRHTLKLLHIPGVENLDDDSAKNLAWQHAIGLAKMMGYTNNSEYPKVSLSISDDVDW